MIFERTKLNEIRKKWEKLEPNFQSDKIRNFTNSGFGTTLCNEGKIMICGGDSVNMNTYLYDIDQNLISINEQCEDILFFFNDKTFYKINNNYNIALPSSLDEEKDILISNKK